MNIDPLLTHTERQAVWAVCVEQRILGDDGFERALCRAQVEKMKRLGAVMLAKDQDRPPLRCYGLQTTNEQYQRGFEDGYKFGLDSMASAGFRLIEEIE